MRILLVEDDDALAAALIDHFSLRGFALERAGSLEDAALMLATSRYAALILDRGLPDGDGIELLQSLRAQRDTLSVIVLTARGEIASRIAGLDAGADDYLAKPFSPDELAARLRAVLRRNGAYQEREIICANLVFDIENLVLRIDGGIVILSQRETCLLRLLLRRVGLVVTKRLAEDQLLSAGEPLGSNAIEVYIHRLRHKLEAAGSRAEIVTLRGLGYVLRPCS
ncbi:response regulator transcription factor [Sphingobium sp. EM0848]|uniref:response regulator transcription factor n=1 Tax=Sphingobium sp. EM0848 TaxID=2743473 RepID=UPI00159C4C00|nr:response regulator transcription factor [Sphingobium sp. EM0848]